MVEELKASSLSALYDLKCTLSPREDDQFLSIAPLERDGRGYAYNVGWEADHVLCFVSYVCKQCSPPALIFYIPLDEKQNIKLLWPKAAE